MVYFLNNNNYIKIFFYRINKFLDFRNFDYYLRFKKFSNFSKISSKLFKYTIFYNLLENKNIFFKKIFYSELTQINRVDDLELRYNNFNKLIFDYYINYKNFIKLRKIIYYCLFFFTYDNVFSLFLKNKNSNYFLTLYNNLSIFIKDSKLIKLLKTNSTAKKLYFYNSSNISCSKTNDPKNKLIFNIKNSYIDIVNYEIGKIKITNKITKTDILNYFIFNYLYNNKKDYINNNGLVPLYNSIYIKKLRNLNSFTIINSINKKTVTNNLFNKLKCKIKFEECISNFIFGQNTQLIKFSTVDLNNTFNGCSINNVKPLGSWIICGPSGTGKTETAKIISKLLYNKLKFIKFDMSEFMEKHSISRLIGSPPGYAGYEKGGELTNFVNKNNNSVILFDEAEKADRTIYDVLLQTLDEGILTDSKGVKVKFNNTVLIFTSNIGYDSYLKNTKFNNLETINKLKKFFRIEFLNRLDDIVIYSNLDIFSIYKILDKYFYKVDNLISNDKEFKLILSLIFKKCNISTRKIIRLIDKMILNKNNNNIFIAISNKSLFYIIK